MPFLALPIEDIDYCYTGSRNTGVTQALKDVTQRTTWIQC